MKNTPDLREITDLAHPDSITMRATMKANPEATEVASEEAIVAVNSEAIVVASSEAITVEVTSVARPEATSEAATLLEALAVSADRAVETMALEELALTNNEKGIFKRVLILKCDDT